MDAIVEQVDGVVLLTIPDEQIDASNVNDFKRDVGAAMAPGAKMAIDLSRVRFIDSSGCGVILSTYRHLKELGGEIKLCCVQKSVKAVFELVRMHRLLDILDTRDQAIAAFKAK